MSHQAKPRLVDESVIKVSQAATILLLLLAFVLDVWLIVAILAVINVLGAAVPSLSLWRLIYKHVLKPAGIVKANVIPDNPEPHRFASAVGGTLAVCSTLALVLGAPVLGWILAWFYIILASLNLFIGFCLGCFTYYQLNRLGVPGFSREPIESTEG